MKAMCVIGAVMLGPPTSPLDVRRHYPFPGAIVKKTQASRAWMAVPHRPLKRTSRIAGRSIV
jgi:hypothetical protein